MTRTIGSLFTGYGGLDMAVEAVLDAETVWVCDVEDGPRRVLEARRPGVPNLGDITEVDWSTVPRVDILTGGSPCQDVSHAGAAAGMVAGTRSNLWIAMREAIAELRPGLVVWENVRGVLSAKADSEMGLDSGRVDRRGKPVPNLRALGRVLGDLASLGYDAQWTSVRASDVGAPHQRLRVFLVASDARRLRGDAWWCGDGDARPEGPHGQPERGRGAQPDVTLLPTPMAADGSGGRAGSAKNVAPGAQRGPNLPTVVANLFPTPLASEGFDGCVRSVEGGTRPSGARRSLNLPTVVANLLPTPVVNDMGDSKTLEWWDGWLERMRDQHHNGNGHGRSLAIEAQRMLHTPTVSNSHGNDRNGQGLLTLPGQAVDMIVDYVDGLLDEGPSRFGKYTEAVELWERVLGRRAPNPTQPSRTGKPDGQAAARPAVRRVVDGSAGRLGH